MKQGTLLFILVLTVSCIRERDDTVVLDREDRDNFRCRLVTQFPSTVAAFAIPGAHSIHHSDRVFRSMMPCERSHYETIRGERISQILIVKKDTTDGAVEFEKELLSSSYGFTPSQIAHYPLEWKRLPSYRKSCEQLVESLAVLKKTLETPDGKVLFHCTVGEDRTGLLAGLFRQLVETELGKPRWSASRAFSEEMCRWGYEAGNPSKPENVIREVRAALTPLYRRMSALIEEGSLNWGTLNAGVCDRVDGEQVQEVQWKIEEGMYVREGFICSPSPEISGQ